MTDTTNMRRDFEAWATENYWLIVSKDDAFGIWQAATACSTPKWQPIATVPKDGSEFIAAYARQGFVKKLINWDCVHGQWLSKGKWVPGFETNATHWASLPLDL